jgi:cyclopropane fatty-acyl-phospholipid synthase-like methyltransferase
MEKPFSLSCDKNKGPILEVLKKYIDRESKTLLEIGSGSGQHASFFSKEFPNLTWVTTDKNKNHEGIKLWQKEVNLDNFKGPEEYEVGVSPFPIGDFDYIFSANTFHIMSWKLDKTLMKQLGKNMKSKALFMVYGPFNYLGKFTSPSNEEFDGFLKKRDPQSGIRTFEDVTNNMAKNGFYLLEDVEMPSNNRTLIFEKS